MSDQEFGQLPVLPHTLTCHAVSILIYFPTLMHCGCSEIYNLNMYSVLKCHKYSADGLIMSKIDDIVIQVKCVRYKFIFS